uniref:Hypothetical conserved protein n=1 Tax=uncultured Chloroflexota bacterium TaxID=166587 RepID=H5SA54_9CHLR|nr:hypothetical conserved protein [uncultured Chloroflexota bacterium]
MFPILQIRRNHALEHATLHVLARDLPQRPLAGYSYSGGIFIFGDVPTEMLMAALHEAEMRLRQGEHYLAIHPGCGTNLSMALFLTTGLAWLPLRGRTDSPRRWGWRIPAAVLLALLGLFLARLLGPWAQKYLTTEANLGDLTILGVDRVALGPWQLHHIRTGGK